MVHFLTVISYCTPLYLPGTFVIQFTLFGLFFPTSLRLNHVSVDKSLYWLCVLLVIMFISNTYYLLSFMFSPLIRLSRSILLTSQPRLKLGLDYKDKVTSSQWPKDLLSKFLMTYRYPYTLSTLRLSIKPTVGEWVIVKERTPVPFFVKTDYVPRLNLVSTGGEIETKYGRSSFLY